MRKNQKNVNIPLKLAFTLQIQKILSNLLLEPLEIGQNTSSFILINHLQKRAIQKFEESLKYTVITFISDVGGILGIFLGFSFWSIHATAIIPLLKKIFKPSSSEVQPWTGYYTP